MNIPELNYLCISDIHLGHNTNPTVDIVTNLKKYFITYHKYIKQTKIIFIAGDIFDKLLVNGSKPFLLALEWLTLLAMYCKKHNIKLRILEGTPSHDWRQASVFNTALKKLEIDIDFKYIDTLVIENMPDFGINILYVPDEYKHTGIETFKEVQELMKTLELTQVDIAIMHGQFHYQLPMVTLESSHNEEDYVGIVKHFISIGHIHKHSVNGKILAQGSFDRLAHNEEEPKGGMIMSIREHIDDSFIFLENPHAKEYVTLDYSKVDIDDVRAKLDTATAKLKIGAHLRLLVTEDSKLTKHRKDISQWYPNLTIKIEIPKDKSVDVTTDKLISFSHLDSFHITPENITDLLATELANYTIEKKDASIIDTELLQCL